MRQPIGHSGPREPHQPAPIPVNVGHFFGFDGRLVSGRFRCFVAAVMIFVDTA
jgi:hypothetical protein